MKLFTIILSLAASLIVCQHSTLAQSETNDTTSNDGHDDLTLRCSYQSPERASELAFKETGVYLKAKPLMQEDRTLVFCVELSSKQERDSDRPD